MLASTSSRNCCKIYPWRQVVLFDRGVPGAADAVAGGVARGLVLDPAIEGHALIGHDLLIAALAVDEGEITRDGRRGVDHDRRPIDGALVVAVRNAHGVLVPDIKGHALG